MTDGKSFPERTEGPAEGRRAWQGGRGGWGVGTARSRDYLSCQSNGLRKGSVNMVCKGQSSEYFRLCGPYGGCHSYLRWPSVRESNYRVCKWVGVADCQPAICRNRLWTEFSLSVVFCWAWSRLSLIKSKNETNLIAHGLAHRSTILACTKCLV